MFDLPPQKICWHEGGIKEIKFKPLLTSHKILPFVLLISYMTLYLSNIITGQNCVHRKKINTF